MVLERPLTKLQVQTTQKAIEDLQWQVDDAQKNSEKKARRAVATAEKRVQTWQSKLDHAANVHEAAIARNEHNKALTQLHFRRAELENVPSNILALTQQLKEKENKLKESEKLTEELRKASARSSAQAQLEITRRTQQVKTDRLINRPVRPAESPESRNGSGASSAITSKRAVGGGMAFGQGSKPLNNIRKIVKKVKVDPFAYHQPGRRLTISPPPSRQIQRDTASKSDGDPASKVPKAPQVSGGAKQSGNNQKRKRTSYESEDESEEEMPTKRTRRAAPKTRQAAPVRPKRKLSSIEESSDEDGSSDESDSDSADEPPRKKARKDPAASAGAPSPDTSGTMSEENTEKLKSSVSSLGGASSTSTHITTPDKPDCIQQSPDDSSAVDYASDAGKRTRKLEDGAQTSSKVARKDSNLQAGLGHGERLLQVKLGGKLVWKVLTSSGTLKGTSKVTKQERFERDTPVRVPESEDDYELRGLINMGAACFANCALQFLNAALSFDQIKMLRGTEALSSFSYTHQNLQSLFDDQGLKKSRARKEIEKLRLSIAIQGAMSPGEKIPIAPYLGQVLLDMREGISHKSKTSNVNPILLQQVFAYGGHHSRRQYDGDTQEDAFDYLMLLVNAVTEEHAFMGKIFEAQSNVRERCKDCLQESTMAEPAFGHKIQVPGSGSSRAATPIELRDLIKESLAAVQNPSKSCSACGKKDTVVGTTALGDVGHRLLVQLDRTQLYGERPMIKKTMTKISLRDESMKIQVGNDSFEAKAFMRHDGRQADRGHYTTFIKHQGIWNKLDDLSCSRATSADMVDGRNDLCCAVLFHKVEQNEQLATQQDGEEAKSPDEAWEASVDGEAKAIDKSQQEEFPQETAVEHQETEGRTENITSE